MVGMEQLLGLFLGAPEAYRRMLSIETSLTNTRRPSQFHVVGL